MAPKRLTSEERFLVLLAIARSKEDGNGCWPWPNACDRDGYGLFSVRTTSGGWRQWRAHRYAYFIVHGPIRTGVKILHRCDNPPCIRDEHLRSGTLAENNKERDERGRTSSGARHYRAKLNKVLADQIRARYDAGDGSYAAGRKGRAAGNAAELMAEYRIGRSTLYRVLRRELWI
jgi:HNH endonuclease